jgi:hypothetical protein
MVPYDRKATRIIHSEVGSIASFCDASPDSNIDRATVDAFGEEWARFPRFDELELSVSGDQYFDVVTSGMLGIDTQAGHHQFDPAALPVTADHGYPDCGLFFSGDPDFLTSPRPLERRLATRSKEDE